MEHLNVTNEHQLNYKASYVFSFCLFLCAFTIIIWTISINTF